MPRTANTIEVIGKKRALSLLLTQHETIIAGLASLVERLGRIEQRQETFMTQLEQDLAALREQIAGLSTQVETLQTGIDTEQAEVKAVTVAQQEVITALEEKVKDLEAGTPVDLSGDIAALKSIRERLVAAGQDLAETIATDPGASTEGNGTAPAGDGSVTSGTEG